MAAPVVRDLLRAAGDFFVRGDAMKTVGMYLLLFVILVVMGLIGNEDFKTEQEIREYVVTREPVDGYPAVDVGWEVK